MARAGSSAGPSAPAPPPAPRAGCSSSAVPRTASPAPRSSSARAALLAALLAAAALAPRASAAGFEACSQEACSEVRHSSVTSTGGAPPAGQGYVLIKDLGPHTFDGTWPTLPVVNPKTGHVMIADVDGFMLALESPEVNGAAEYSEDDDGGIAQPSAWRTVGTYTKSGAIMLGGPAPQP